ncbi:putative arrestin (or S-antigen), C-terminal domain [Lyophyllum shimeji]|uniref:Arrestin (Or S-antigen), C-terminal domain n=1 Tax=Lyophyllum shimeji TaxID=47721 RepID=A0A9P3PKF2_LYOSH|nr:putative arrestin (or S-antigen), C-terminal domain [Lyophyllum shimeji]
MERHIFDNGLTENDGVWCSADRLSYDLPSGLGAGVGLPPTWRSTCQTIGPPNPQIFHFFHPLAHPFRRDKMAFVLSRTSSPCQRDSFQIGADNTQMPPASPATGPSSSPDHDQHHHHDMAKEKDHKPRIEILLDSPYLFLKGVGVDVEPTLLSGHVALHLNEAMPIKEIKLQFRGKARLPVPAHEAMSINGAPLTYIVCNHDWSFLEGEKRTSHTLKAGRHLFPFQLRIGGSLPSTISSPAFGGAAVNYKLRAHVVRPGFAFNQTYQAGLPIHIIRSFAPEAMEYQQTLEIENTWPEKLMYSIMVPHKAWAAGDKVTALVKFSPLAKGVCVLNVTTSIHEHTKVYARSGAQESTRLVASLKHEIVNGRAVEIDDSRIGQRRALTQPPSPACPESPSSGLFSFPLPRTRSSGSLSSMARPSFLHSSAQASTSSSPAIPPDPPLAGSPATSSGNTLDDTSLSHPETSDVEAYLSIDVPLTITPTHGLEPIIVSHRIRWNILILNLDGHTSELRCSLPLYLLDYRLLSESKIHSAPARRLLLGGAEVPPQEEEDVQLPSYMQHVRDRVANMYLPDSATMRATNPWISQGASPVPAPDSPLTTWPLTRSGRSTPLEAQLLTHLPHQPDPNASNAPLEWVNSELLLSLSDRAPPRLRAQSPVRGEPGSDSEPPSRGSRPVSRVLSRLSSRASSPERGHHHQHHPHPHPPEHTSGAHETYLHGGQASRNVHDLFRTTMKPFTSFHPHWISRSSSAHTLPTEAELERERESAEAAARPAHLRRISVPARDPSTGTELLHRAFTEVPDYAVAARGFLGGVPPLESMQGLPSYEETVRTRSESDLAARFARLSTAAATANTTASAPSGSPPELAR